MALMTKRRKVEKVPEHVVQETIEGLLTLPWVQGATHTHIPEGTYKTAHEMYTLITKPDMLMRTIDKQVQVHIHPNDNFAYEGMKLEKSIQLPLPAMKFALTERSMSASLAVKPDFKATAHPLYGSYPLDDPHEPRNICFGEYSTPYRSAKTWNERAAVAAEYMQSAQPESGSSQTPSGFMYFLGLMPHELIEMVPAGDPYTDYVQLYYDEDNENDDDTDEDEDW